MKNAFFLFLTPVLFLNTLLAQDKNEIVYWSETRKLTIDDFLIRTRQSESSSSFGQFTISYKLKGLDFLSKNFNKKVENGFIRTASWIDTSANPAQSLAYQQTLFNLAEIYARQFRKRLREKRKELSRSLKIADQLNNNIMAEFAKRRIEYDGETNFGTDDVKQKEWEAIIQTELEALKDFSYDR